MRDQTTFACFRGSAVSGRYETFVSAVAFRSLIVFDLDNTLIHSVPEQVAGAPFQTFPVDMGGENGVWQVYIRPHIFDFFKLLEDLDVPYAVWTAGDEQYAEWIVKGLKQHGKFVPRFVWARGKTTVTPDGEHVKDMRKIRRYKKAVLLDDSEHHKRYFENQQRVQVVPGFYATVARDDFFKTLSQLTVKVLNAR